MRFALAVFLLGLASPLAAQGPELVQDIATGSPYWPGSYAGLPVSLHGRGYFGANDGFSGYELWSTDGTIGGTRLFADLCPGRCAGNPFLLTVAGPYLFFVAANTTYGYDSFWVWRSDGTVEGTIPLVDLEIPGTGAYLPLSYFGPYGNGVVFVVHERDRQGWGLWASDGTRAGTRRIASLPGQYDSGNLPIDYDWPRAQDEPGKHYFTWQGRPWATDGTATGTRPLRSPLVPCSFGSWARLGGLVIYSGEVGRENCEPWVSDGTAQGSHRLRELNPGNADSYPGELVAAGNRVYFTAFDERGRRLLWKSDGTTRGTVSVRAKGARHTLAKVQILAVSGARVYFAADDGEHGVELWRTDGNPDSTVLAAELSPGPGGTSFGYGGHGFQGRRLFFAATPEGEGHDVLFVTEGTADSTLRLHDLGIGGTFFSVTGGRIYFAGSLGGEVGEGFGVTDGTVAGTRVFDLAHPVRSSEPRQLTATPGGLLFTVSPDVVGTEVWRTGGHAQDTEPLIGAESGQSPGTWLYPGLGGAFYFTFSQGRLGWTDGRTARELLPPGSTGTPVGLTERGGRAIFLAGRAAANGGHEIWIWTSDATPEGTAAVGRAVNHPSRFDSYLWTWVAAPEAGDLRYLVQEFEYFPVFLSNLSETDGTAAGTRSLVRFPVPKLFTVRAFVAAGSNVFALFNEQSPRQALWVSDGTAEGTRAVIVGPGDDRLSFIDNALVAAGDRVFLPVDTATTGVELWVSDGTPVGTHPVMEIAPGAVSSNPTDLVAFGDRLLFSADDREHGRELWITDGTPDGTSRLEIHPGPKGSYPQAIRAVGDRAFFAADDGIHGLELWVTDGTPEGTRLAADVLRGPLGSSPSGFEIYGDDLFFAAGRPQEGYELWKLPLADVSPR